jgi:glycosyltransferase involved in cell wall biosynthesis
MKGSRSLSALVLVEAALHHLIGSYSRYVDRFVVPSRFYAKKLQEWGWSADKFRYIPNFVDSSSYVPDYEAGDRFVYFGRLSREKGLQTLIRATAISRSKLAIAGTGPEIAKLRELAGEIQADVQFLGFLSGDALKDAVRSARAVVLPSEWYENAPISILESYALGKPVVGARIGGIPELIREHETGLQFESGNANSLADAMVAIKRLDAQAIGNMGREGRRWVEAEFTPEMYRARTLDVYQELLPSISGHHFEDVAANS